jgi:hypothetical protein
MPHPDLYSNMNFPAPASILGFLGACGGLVLSLLAIGVAYFARKPRLGQLLLKLTAAGALFYLGLLLAFAWSSKDYLLTQGQEKHFCEIDCHLAYSVLSVKSESSGDWPSLRNAQKARPCPRIQEMSNCVTRRVGGGLLPSAPGSH